jgi:hypothetical protein
MPYDAGAERISADAMLMLKVCHFPDDMRRALPARAAPYGDGAAAEVAAPASFE